MGGMSKYLRADILVLVGFALEVGAVVALWFCYLLQHFIDVVVILLVVSGCFFSLGIVAFLYTSLALGGSTSSSAGDREIGT
jgi:hypothetical protein